MNKLKQAIEKAHPDRCTPKELETRSGVDRDTIKKIRDLLDGIDTKPIPYRCWEALFNSFTLDLLEEDVY